MADDETTGTEVSALEGAPQCPKCEAQMFATTRKMRVHDMGGASAIARDQIHPVWRCMRCQNEIPREA